MTRYSLLALLLGAAATASSNACAADKMQKVQFKKGATSATLSSEIKGYDGIVYTFSANAGQTTSILFSPKHNACYFNLMAPNSDTAIHIGEAAGNEFAGKLPVSGEYKAQVYLMRSAARRNEKCKFSMTIEITGNAVQAAAPPSGAEELPMQNACAEEAVRMYGVDRAKIRYAEEGRVAPVNGGFVIQGEADKGAEGKKQFQCKFGSDRKLTVLMPLNSDGE